MLKLTRQQKRIFADAARDGFVDRLIRRLHDHWPAEARRASPERFREVVQTTVRLAMDLGFRTEFDVARFIHLAFAFGTVSYYEQPWAAEIMNVADLQPRVRMNRLFEAGIAQLREAGPRG